MSVCQKGEKGVNKGENRSHFNQRRLQQWRWVLQPWRYQLLCLHYHKWQSVTRHRPLILGEPSPVAQAGSCKPQSSSSRNKCVAACHVARHQATSSSWNCLKLTKTYHPSLFLETENLSRETEIPKFQDSYLTVSATIVWVQRWSPGTSFFALFPGVPW